MEYSHTPVMLDDVLEYLALKPGDNVIDCTMGGMGYSMEFARRVAPEGTVLAIDLDGMAIKNAKSKLKKEKITNIKIVNDNFKNLRKIIGTKWPKNLAKRFSGIVFDLGLSSAQLEDRTRGFSFKVDAPLKMGFGLSIHDDSDFGINDTEMIVNKYAEGRLRDILRDYGEERYAGNIARQIVEGRKEKEIVSTGELVDLISRAVPESYKKSNKIHFATRTFQALRIATNNEMESLTEALEAAVDLLSPGGKVIVISYHSLEDRIVKRFFREQERRCICPKEAPLCSCDHVPKLEIVTKRIITPSLEEIGKNPRARSAKMRVAKRINV